MTSFGFLNWSLVFLCSLFVRFLVVQGQPLVEDGNRFDTFTNCFLLKFWLELIIAVCSPPMKFIYAGCMLIRLAPCVEFLMPPLVLDRLKRFSFILLTFVYSAQIQLPTCDQSSSFLSHSTRLVRLVPYPVKESGSREREFQILLILSFIGT